MGWVQKYRRWAVGLENKAQLFRDRSLTARCSHPSARAYERIYPLCIPRLPLRPDLLPVLTLVSYHGVQSLSFFFQTATAMSQLLQNHVMSVQLPVVVLPSISTQDLFELRILIPLSTRKVVKRMRLPIRRIQLEFWGSNSVVLDLWTLSSFWDVSEDSTSCFYSWISASSSTSPCLKLAPCSLRRISSLLFFDLAHSLFRTSRSPFALNVLPETQILHPKKLPDSLPASSHLRGRTRKHPPRASPGKVFTSTSENSILHDWDFNHQDIAWCLAHSRCHF